MIQIDKILDHLAMSKDRFIRGGQSQKNVWNGINPVRQPLLLRCNLGSDEIGQLPDYSTKETHYDSEKMFLSGLKDMLNTAAGGMECVPSIRANMGCGIFATLFPGIRQELYDDKMPWVRQHLAKEKIAAMEVEDLRLSAEFSSGLQHMSFMAERLAGTGCSVFPMDVQGPFNLAHLVYGDSIFYDLFDDPGFVHHLLELSCHAIYLGMASCLEVIPESDNQIAHYNELVMPRSKGGIKISEDTSTLLSKDQVDEFAAPYLSKVLDHFGGGYVHYCGKNPHLFDIVMQLPLAYGLNLGNPEKHDMAEILQRCRQSGKVYYGSIPQGQGETMKQHFLKLLSASGADDRSILLLSCDCQKNTQDAMIHDWVSAAENC